MLILQDPNNQYSWCETRFDQRLFIRFTDYLLLIGHIQTNLSNYRTQIHLFLPDFQLQLIDTFRHEYNGILKYIYCPNQSSVGLIKQQYGIRADHKIFTTSEIDFYFDQVLTELLYLLSKQAPDGSNDQDRLATAAMQHLDGLCHLLKQLRDDQPGDQPVEWF